MMTTMAALLGGLPLALGRGTGSELRHPLGITIVGGLLVSQLLTLYTTPVVYLWFDRLAQRFSHVKIGNQNRGTRRRTVQRGLEHEYFRSIYQASDRHVAAGGGAADGGSAGVQFICRSRRCRRWNSRSSRSGPDCRARVRRPWLRRWRLRWSASSAASPASTR